MKITMSEINYEHSASSALDLAMIYNNSSTTNIMMAGAGCCCCAACCCCCSGAVNFDSCDDDISGVA